MGEVFYSSMKFKKNLRQGTAATQDEDVTYSEVKINNPTTSNTVCHCGSAGHSGQSSHPYRWAAVCLGLLCALLLAATLVPCVLYTSLSGTYSMLERDLEELRGNNITMNKEKDQQQKNNAKLKRDLAELTTRYNTMNKEKDQQQTKNAMLERDLAELTTRCNTMNKEKVQQQSNYKAVFKKCPFLEQYCPSSSPSIVCQPCPQGWSQFSSKCYYFSNERKSWMDSRSDCNKQGADLVIIESDEEQRFITNIAKHYTWIGLSYSADKRNWLWVDGTPLQKGFWGNGEPAYQSGVDCVMITWAAYYCSTDQNWICEADALLP